MAKKLLITGGCSYTDPEYTISDPSMDQNPGPWPMWPEYLGHKLDLEVLNTGASGSSNEKIFHETMEKIIQYRDRVDTVAILWTEFDRSRFYGVTDWMPISEAVISLGQNAAFPDGTGFEWRDVMGLSNVLTNFFKSKIFWSVRHQFVKNSIHDSFRYMLMMAEYCKAYNIKYIFMQGLAPFQWMTLNRLAQELPMNTQPNGELPQTDMKEYIDYFIKNPWFGNIDKGHKKNIVGWPLEPQLNGYYLDFVRYGGANGFEKSEEGYNVSNIDLHPNAEAQEITSNIFYQRYKEIYG
jgi:hypothetical protein